MILRIRLLTCHLLLLTLLMPSFVAAQSNDRALERAKKLLRSTPLIDGHNDLPWEIRERKEAPRNVEAYDLRTRTAGHTDLARLAQGQVGAQFWSIYIPGQAKD